MEEVKGCIEAARASLKSSRGTAVQAGALSCPFCTIWHRVSTMLAMLCLSWSFFHWVIQKPRSLTSLKMKALCRNRR